MITEVTELDLLKNKYSHVSEEEIMNVVENNQCDLSMIIDELERKY